MATQPFFVPQKEVDLFDAVNEELIDDIIGQAVNIYKVSLEETDSNIYGEAINGGAKIFEEGYQVNCLISFPEPTVDQDELGPDTDGTIEMYFLRTSLSGSGFYPEISDIVDWNDFYWEINAVVEPQLIAGYQSFKHDVKATANRTRLSAVNFSERVK